MPIRKTTRKSAAKRSNEPDPQALHDEENKRRFVARPGVEASELPDGGRDDVYSDPHKDAGRNLPHQHGGELGEEGGIRGDRELSDADRHGRRKRN